MFLGKKILENGILLASNQYDIIVSFWTCVLSYEIIFSNSPILFFSISFIAYGVRAGT